MHFVLYELSFPIADTQTYTSSQRETEHTQRLARHTIIKIIHRIQFAAIFTRAEKYESVNKMLCDLSVHMSRVKRESINNQVGKKQINISEGIKFSSQTKDFERCFGVTDTSL